MINHISLCFNHKRRLSRHMHFTFSDGFNVIIGPNGSGKSTLLNAIYKCRDCKSQKVGITRYYYFNGEIMNPHRAYKYFKGLSGSVIRARALFSSHGETMRDVLGSYHPQKGDCFLLDEPENGHDIEWVMKIRKGFDVLVKAGCQVIVASHHPVFWKNAKIIELKRNYRKSFLKIMSKQIGE